MIVKTTILRLLGSNDDKEKEKIGVARPKGPPLWGFRLLLWLSEEPTHEAPVHPMVVGRTDAMLLWCRRESKPSQLIGTG